MMFLPVARCLLIPFPPPTSCPVARTCSTRKVFFASASPAIRHPNVYGIDMATRDELVAARRSEDEVAAFIGADWLVYQDLADLEASVRELNPALASFDSSCFNGVYCTGAVSEDYLSALSAERSDGMLIVKNSEAHSVGRRGAGAAVLVS